MTRHLSGGRRLKIHVKSNKYLAKMLQFKHLITQGYLSSVAKKTQNFLCSRQRDNLQIWLPRLPACSPEWLVNSNISVHFYLQTLSVHSERFFGRWIKLWWLDLREMSLISTLFCIILLPAISRDLKELYKVNKWKQSLMFRIDLKSRICVNRKISLGLRDTRALKLTKVPLDVDTLTKSDAF